MRYKHAMILINGKSPAQILRERIEFEGTLPNGSLKLQTFLNHQVDCALLATCGQHLAYRFTHTTQEFTKILAPRSGVMVAQACAVHMRLPMVIVVTKPPMTSSPNAVIYKHTRPTGGVYSEEVDLYVSSEVRRHRPTRPAQVYSRRSLVACYTPLTGCPHPPIWLPFVASSPASTSPCVTSIDRAFPLTS
jgi:hypothetical protein